MKKLKGLSTCQSSRHSPPAVSLHPWEWPTRPWSRLHTDYAGPFCGRMLFVVIDAHSKWIEVIHVTSATSKETIDKLRNLFDSLTN